MESAKSMPKAEGMTQEEKHALIAERLEGWTRDTKFAHWPCGKPYQYPHRSFWRLPDGSFKVAGYPSYSTDLNLCARVERKIQKMGKVAEYFSALSAIGDDSCAFIASAATRVDAMILLLERMAKP